MAAKKSTRKKPAKKRTTKKAPAKRKKAGKKKPAPKRTRKKSAKKKAAKKTKKSKPKKTPAKKTTRKSTAAKRKTVRKKTPSKRKAAPKKKRAKRTDSAAKKKTATRRTEPNAESSQSVTQSEEHRSIGVGRDAIGNAMITGDGNIVVVQMEQRYEEVLETSTDEPDKIGPNPYKGLAAFLEEDADHFFGRESQTTRLWESLRDLRERASGDDHCLRLLPVLGPSGSGKSSLVRAGLIPELARRPMPGCRSARVAVLKPGAHPLESLAGVLAKIATQDAAPIAKTREFAGELKRANSDGQFDGLRRIAGVLPDIAASPLLVFVDQFEETYSLCEDEDDRSAFIGNLLTAAADRSANVSVIFTLRTDYLEQTQHHPQLNTAIANQGVIVPALNEDELRRAICEPARLAGHPLDDAVVELLVHETKGRDGALPLLQFALTRIWDGLREGAAPSETLKQIGGVGGALAREAQRIYDSLPEEEQEITRRVFLGLVNVGEGTRDARRRAVIASLVASGDDPRDVDEVIQRFSSKGARLITVSADPSGEETAEVTHEALFEHWRTLDQWLAESRDDLRFQRRLDQAARHWDQHDRADGLLWRSPDLDLLDAFHERAADDMTPVQLEFFDASQRQVEEEIAMRRRRIRITSALSISTVAFLLLALAGTSIGYRNTKRAQQEAEENAKRARQAAFDMVAAVGDDDDIFAVPELAKADQQLMANALKHLETLSDTGVKDRETRLKSAEALRRLGDVLRHVGKNAEAIRKYSDAIVLLKKLTAEYPGFFAAKHELALSQKLRGFVRTKHHRQDSARGGLAMLDEARQDFESALQLWEELARDRPAQDQVEARVELAAAHHTLGFVLHRMNKENEAEERYNQAIKMLQALTQQNPQHALNARIRHELARCLNNRANLRDDQEHAQAVHDDYTAAIGILQQLQTDYPDNQQYKFDTAKCYNNLANLTLRDKPDVARTFNDEAIRLFRQVTMNIPELASEYANGFNTRGAINVEERFLDESDGQNANRRWEAIAAYREASKILEVLLDLSNGDVEIQGRYFDALYNLGFEYVDLNDYQAAFAAGEPLLSLKLRQQQYIDLAGLITACCKLALADWKQSTSDRPKDLAEKYGREAINMLSNAIDVGYPAEELRSRLADFEALRQLDGDPLGELLEQTDSSP